LGFLEISRKFLEVFWKSFGSFLEVFGTYDAQKKEKMLIFDGHF